MEAMLLTVGIALLAPELFGTTNPPSPSYSINKNITGNKIRPMAALAFLLGAMSVSIRFTSLAA